MADRFEHIDAELDALGVSGERARQALQSARQIVAALGGLDAALKSLGQEKLLAARAIPSKPAATPAKPARPSPDAGEQTDVHSSKELEEALAREKANQDIAGLSVDDLFADTSGSEPPTPSQEEGLASLFADEPEAPAVADEGLAALFDDEPLRMSDPELPLDALEPSRETLDLEPSRETLELEPKPAGPPEPRAEPSEPPSPFEAPSSEFELLVDEDMLELDDDDPKADE